MHAPLEQVRNEWGVSPTTHFDPIPTDNTRRHV